MLIANHTLQLLIPYNACCVTITYNAQEEEFYTEATAKARKLLPPTFEFKRTVSVTVMGNGAKFTERYLTKERADEQVWLMAQAERNGEAIFAFGRDVEAEEYAKSLREAIEAAKNAATPAYKVKGGKKNAA